MWRRAAEISGIEDRDTLLQAALTAFIQKEAARQLAAMGGTMPNLQLPPRERSAS
ncbi:MAG: type II toxin-antitoxin system VapB family antitoxin [Novosphingobium sp.]|nr:type II toxin-antitoxin system VapB family antitoxin [Novosphingobium sp.]